MAPDRTHHPCFNDAARSRFARIHLPVAPDCNVQCNFCKRVYDCANESRPGVTSAVLTPPQAENYLCRVVQQDPRIAVVGVAGPGDPFASPETTLDTLRRVRRRYPEMLLCVASNGLNVLPYADEMAELAVSHVTLTVNAVNAEIGAKIYAWVRDGKRIHRGAVAAALLWERQSEAIAALKRRSVAVKINTIIIPGVNDAHAVEVVRQVAQRGADISNCVPLYPVRGTALAGVEPPSAARMTAIRAEASAYLPMMTHCRRCRADAVGLLGEPAPAHAELAMIEAAAPPIDPRRPYVAVATREGALVNEHLGEARRLAIFAPAESGFRLVETRPAPPLGGGPARWQELAARLRDCRAVLAAGAGEAPRTALAEEGLRVILMEGLIEEGLDAVYRGATIRSPMRAYRCGSGCSGSGMGCS